MPLAWLNGALTSDVCIDPSDRGFLLADGLFETLRAEHGTPLHAGRHFARLRAGAAVLELPLPWSDLDLLEAMTSVLAAAALPLATLRLTLTRGPAPRGVLPPADVHPTCLITAAPLPPVPAAARVVIATVTRRNEHSPLARLKTLNYLDSILARQDAARLGADDAILLNCAGRVAEATAGNIVITVQGETITPPVEEGALPGIARALLLESGRVREHPITPDMLHQATAASIVNSLYARPIRVLEGRPLPGWPLG